MRAKTGMHFRSMSGHSGVRFSRRVLCALTFGFSAVVNAFGQTPPQDNCAPLGNGSGPQKQQGAVAPVAQTNAPSQGLLEALQRQYGIKPENVKMAPSYSRPVDESDLGRKSKCTSAGKQASSIVAPSVGTVTVKGVIGTKDDTKRIIGRDLLDNPDEPYVQQVLAKTPGMTVTNRGVSMLGLGERATRILVDGRRPPIGFRLSGVRGSDVERIEYTFGSDAAYAGQGFAGTINIVMRRNSVKARSNLSLSMSGGSDTGVILGISATRPLGTYSSHSLNIQALDMDTGGRFPDSALTRWRGLIRPQGETTNRSLGSSSTSSRNAFYSLTTLLPDSSSIRYSLRSTRNETAGQVEVEGWAGEHLDLELRNRAIRNLEVGSGAGMDWRKVLESGATATVAMNYSKNDSEYSTRFEFFPGSIGQLIAPNFSRGERIRRNLELDGSYQWPQIAGITPEVGFDFARSEYSNRGDWFKSDTGTGSHGYQDLGQYSTKSIYAKVLRKMGPSIAVNAGLRKTWYQFEGTLTTTGDRGFDFSGNWIEPSVTVNFSNRQPGDTSLSFSRSVSPPTVERILVRDMPALGAENMPLNATSVGGERGRNIGTIDSLVLTSDLIRNSSSNLFLSFSYRRLENVQADRIYLDGGTWLRQPWSLDRAQVFGASVTVKKDLKLTKWLPGTLQLQGSSSFNRVSPISETPRANTLQDFPKSAAEFAASYRNGPYSLNARVIFRNEGRQYRGPGYYSESVAPALATIGMGYRVNPLWSLGFSVIRLNHGVSENTFLFDDGRHFMQTTSRNRSAPMFTFSISRSNQEK